MLVVLDTVRADGVGIDGEWLSLAPEITRLAGESTVFPNARAPAPWTVPSHASIFTGLYPHQHAADHERFRLSEVYTTLAEALRDLGYATGGFTCNAWLHARGGLQQGFDTYEEIFRLDGQADAGAAAATHALSLWIREATARGKPFFAFVNYFEAHLPYEPPARVLQRVAGGSMEPGERIFTVREAEDYLTGEDSASPDDLARARLLYKAEIAYLDEHVGRLVDQLRDGGLLDRTLLIVTSDHGEHLGEHGLTGHEFSLYEEVLRVPLIVRYPPRFRPGGRVDAAVSLVDIAPTVLDVLGARGAMPQVQGQSLVEVVRSGTRGAEMLASYARPVTLIHGYWRAAHPIADLSRYDVGLRAVWAGRWKYVRTTRGEEVLYDLGGDPREELNLAVSGTGEERERRLLELRRAYQRSFGD